MRERESEGEVRRKRYKGIEIEGERVREEGRTREACI